MAKYVLCLLLQRFILPLVLCGCIAIRPVGISLVYMAVLFALSCLPVAQPDNLKGSTGIFFRLLMAFTIVVTVTQICLLIYWNTAIPSSPGLAAILQYIGLIYYNDWSALETVFWLLPDIAACIFSFIVFSALCKFSKSRKSEDDQLRAIEVEIESGRRDEMFEMKPNQHENLRRLGKFASLASLCVAGVVQPSIASAAYFICFLAASTCLGCNRNLGKKFVIVLRIFGAMMMLHITGLLLYQLPWIQREIHADTLLYRISGIHKIFAEIDGKQVFIEGMSPEVYFNPFVLFAAFFVITSSANFISYSAQWDKKVESSKQDQMGEEQNDDEPTKAKFASVVKKVVKVLEQSSDKKKLSKGKSKSLYAVMNRNVSSFFYRNIFIVANVFMMIWSIAYHSWFGFILLVWANLIWIKKDQRENMMKSSPFLVVYSIALLIIHYVYEIIFSELSQNLSKTNFLQIGLIKYDEHAGLHLLFKSFLTVSFWLTMRMYLQERVIWAHKKTLKFEENVLKLVRENRLRRSEDGIFTRILFVLQKICVYSLMWIIIMILFLIAAIGDDKMTIFRIINMVFCFVFILLFQLSFKLWLKSMFIFWSWLIIYAMVALGSIYAFQFDYFTQFTLLWEIGLKKFDKKVELFLNLLSFTLVIILTGIQMHTFHSRFMENVEKLEKLVAEEIGESSSDSALSKWNKLCSAAKAMIEKLLVFLEIHFIKLFFVLAFLSMTMDVQVFNVLIMLLLLAGVCNNSEAFKKFIAILISILGMVFILAKMLHSMKSYHTENIDTKVIATTCELPKLFDSSADFSADFTRTVIEQWFNLHKDENFTSAIRPYYTLIFSLSVYCGIKVIQQMRRQEADQPAATPTVVFEDVSRLNADKNLGNLLKFLVNYGFYKFGMEVTLCWFIVIIFVRLDFVAVFYIFWFTLLVFRNRDHARRLWRFATFFVAIIIVIQCLLLALLVVFNSCHGRSFEANKEYFAIGSIAIESPKLLVLDFILLTLMTCQLKVFQEEETMDPLRPFEGGGSNQLILSQNVFIDGIQMHEHPIYVFSDPDQVQGFVDILKRYIYRVHFWVSLIIIFYAGSSHITIFSIGYIGFAFVLLWYGTDFYLKPLRTIVKYWDILLLFNVCIIIIKMTIKIFGCRFGRQIPSETCWFAKIFDMPCSDKLKTEFCSNQPGVPYLYDGIAFLVIILQRRIFLSYYFYNVISDTFMTSILASRGAELVEEYKTREVKKQQEDELEHLGKLKMKLNKIKYSTKLSSYPLVAGEEAFLSHDHAIRSGDYYLFSIDESSDLSPVESDNDAVDERKVTFDDAAKTNSKLTLKSKLNFVTREQGFFSKLLRRMHTLSRNFRIIIQVLAAEKKLLKGSLTPTTTESHELAHKLSCLDRDRQLSIMKQVDAKLKRISVTSATNYDAHVIEASSVQGFLRESFYLLMRSTLLLVYLAVIILQITTSSLLSLPLAVFVFLWGTLSFPRPSKGFWISLIAYVQVIVLIKSVSVFNIFWWDLDNIYMKYLGFRKNDSFTPEIFLLLAVFLHRAILEMFGLWTATESSMYKFEEGNFRLVETDEKTSELIQHVFSSSQIASEPSDEKITSTASKSPLIDVLEREKVIFKHHVEAGVDDSKKTIMTLFKDPMEMISASEELIQSNDGQFCVKLRQGDTEMKLRPISSSDNLRTIPVAAVVRVEHEIEEPFDFLLPSMLMSLKKHGYIVTNLIELVRPSRIASRKKVDVYTWIFLCEFVNFFVLLFGFTEFGVKPSAYQSTPHAVIDDIMQNKIPITLLLLLVVQFAMIIIDRVLYLRKSMKGKVCFHLATIVFVHIWMFNILPYNTGRFLSETNFPQVYYFIMCIYFLLSAYQIRCGYPNKILGNFLTKRYGLIRSIAFRIYMAIPFLFEVRVVIDWMCTETSLAFDEWLLVEAVYRQIYLIKNSRLRSAKDPPSGIPVNFLWTKFFIGGGLALLLILIVWFPLIIFAFTNILGKTNVPTEVKVSFELSNYQLYQSSVTKANIIPFDELQYSTMLAKYEKDVAATAFIQDFGKEDIVVVTLLTSSQKMWSLTPPNADKLHDDLLQNKVPTCRFTYEIYRPISMDICNDDYEIEIDAGTSDQLAEIFSKTEEWGEEPKAVNIPLIFPKIIFVDHDGFFRQPSTLINDKTHRNMSLERKRLGSSEWFELKENCGDSENFNFISRPNDCGDDYFTMIIFCEKSFSSVLVLLAGKGIIGLYVTVVIVFARVLRATLFSLGTVSIIVEEIPNVDPITSLCNDIYMVREAKEFHMEEKLVAKLIFLYRSPETLIMWTKLKQQ